MHCPFCGHTETKVIDSRLAGEGRQIRRRRECLACSERFTTFEAAELLLPTVVKTDRSREPFDEKKLLTGMQKALEKRPVSREAIEAAAARICHKLRSLGEREIAARGIGEMVMEELRHLDEVGYVRFASVYRSFQDLDAFRTEIDQLKRHRRRREPSKDQLPLLPGDAVSDEDEMSESLTSQDRAHVVKALDLAARALYTTDPNPRVGCVIAHAERVVGEGWHVRAGEPHAEVLALRAAGPAARGATAYVSLEPCSHTGRTPPCADALIAAGVARVVCCTRDPNPKVSGAGIERLQNAGIAVQVGAYADEARRLNVGYFSRHERGRPYVRLKQAMTLDARTAPAGGGQMWISGAASRADVQTWRARSSAVLTGSGTVRCDDPQLNVRLNYGPWIRQPLRVVLDTMLSMPRTAKILGNNQALVFAAAEAPLGPFRDVNVERVPRAGGGLDLDAVMQNLTAREVNELLIECGPTLAGAFVSRKLVDELVLYVAPKLLGCDAAPLLHIKSAAAKDLPPFDFRDAHQLGDDMRLILKLKQQ